MKKSWYVLVFVLAVATAIALAQTSSSGTSTQPQNPTASPSSTTDQTTATPASQNMDRGKHDKNKATVDDDTLNRQVKDQLSSDAALKNVQAAVSNGVVNLDGTVASKADKKRAKQLVAGIPGVRKVHDRLTVNANATVTPGSNEPANAGVGTTGTSTAGTATSSNTTSNTAGSIAGNAGVSSTTPQTPTASANTATTPSVGSSPSANGMPQSDVSAGANTGVSGAASQTQAGAGVSGAAPSTMPQSSTAGTTGPTSAATAGAMGNTGDQASSMTAMSTDLQKQIQTALQHEPALANDKIQAVVSGDTIDLSGSVASGKERQTALRIAQSFAGNRRVVDHLTVAGQGPGANMGEPSNQRDAGPNGASNPSATPSNPNALPGSTTNPR